MSAQVAVEERFLGSNARELSMDELDSVSGGFGPIEGFEYGAAIGTVAGAAFTGSTIGATRGGLIGGALGFAGGLGWGIGTVIYDLGTKYR